MTLYGLDGRYATALFSAAAKQSQLPAVEQELNRIQAVITKTPALKDFLHNPILSREVKMNGVKELLAKNYSELTRNFFQLLADNRRLDETSKIIESFSALMGAHRGEVPVTVTTAKVCP